MRPGLLIALFLTGALVAAQPFSTAQDANLSFVFLTSGTSSVFVHIPDGWSAPKTSSEFSCPADWIRDAEFSRYVHCACAAPCTSLLQEGAIDFATQSPNASGNYSWNVLAYDQGGKPVYNATPLIEVQTRPKLGLEVGFPSVLLADFPAIFEARLSNGGQAAAESINVTLKILTQDGRDASDHFSYTTPKGIRVGGSDVYLFNVTIEPKSPEKGNYVFSLGGVGYDGNSKDTARASISKEFQILKGANLGVLSLQSQNQLSEKQPFNATVLLKNEGDVPAGRIKVDLVSESAAGRQVLGSSETDEVGVSLVKTLTLAAQAPASGTYTLVPEVTYLEAVSGRTKTAKGQTPLSQGTLTVQTPTALSLSNPSPTLEAFTFDNFTLQVVSVNTGTATAVDASVRLEKVLGGCDLVGLSQKKIGMLASGTNLSTAWTFSTPQDGGVCKFFFQATALDQNSREVVESAVLVSDVPIKARELAKLAVPNLTFFQKDGQWYVTRPLNSSDWSQEVGPNSRLELLVEQVAKRQDQLEARLKSLQVRLEAKATDLPVGSKSLRSELTVDLLTPPPSDSTLDLQILPATDANLPDLASLSGITLGRPLAVVKVDKGKLSNKQEIDTATIILDLEKSAVDAVGGPDYVRMVRDDEGQVTLIPVRLLSSTDSQYRFEAFSQGGLSLFALYAVEQAVPEEKPKSITGEVVLSQFYTKGYAAILIVVVLVGLFVAMRFKNRPETARHKGVTHYDAPAEKPKKPGLPPWEQHKVDKAKKGLDDV